MSLSRLIVAFLCVAGTIGCGVAAFAVNSRNREIGEDYDPTPPPEPVVPVAKHMVSVISDPKGVCTFSQSGKFSVEEGEEFTVYAYPATGFKIKEWIVNGVQQTEMSSGLDLTMGTEDLNIVVKLDYSPGLPPNPSSNYFNPESGELIIDDFSTGDFYSAVGNMVDDYGKVEILTVKGVMDSYDLGYMGNFSKASTIDLSRVSGLSEIGRYSFSGSGASTVLLPADVESIRDYAFNSCNNLSSLIIYSSEPPVCDEYAFYGISEESGLVVFVPPYAISMYQESESWNRFTVLPIKEDLQNLTVRLPENEDASVYSKMWLELTNTKSGQKMHYVMTDRLAYTFSNLIKNTAWNIVLRNERGDVFGRIDNVDVKDENVEVAFETLSKPCSVLLSVMTPYGEDVTGKTIIEWKDASSNYLGQSASISGLPNGMEVMYDISLPQELAMNYRIPETSTYTLKESGNKIVCQLESFPVVKVTGKVKDEVTGLPLDGALVTASQTYCGKYGNTVSSKTDKNGSYELEIKNVPTSLTFSVSDYISSTIDCEMPDLSQVSLAMSDISLKPLSGAVISLGFTFRKSVAEGEEDSDLQDWYSDYANISYAIYNKTAGHAINQFNAQYPSIVLLEEVNEGDLLELTATSLNSSFVPVKTEVVVDNVQHATATFDIVEPGKIRASFLKNGNSTVSGTLYDEKGKLVKTYVYTNSMLTVGNLPDGKYTLITMGESKLFNDIYDLANLSTSGLVKDIDYVSDSVEVKSGVISEVVVEEVPLLDESKLYYTGSATSFTVNKPSIVAGNYLTLTGKVDFKGMYSSDVDNVSLIVDLPENCTFVENSVMVGNATGGYLFDGNRLTIPMENYSDRVRFCVMPTRGGDYSPSALVKFDLKGETLVQPIGAAKYTAKDLSIAVPSVVAKNTIPVSGTAIGKSTVEIYDGDMLIGQTQSLANGIWSTTCELVDPYNLSTHQIYAKVTSKDGVELRSETAECTYDMNAIRVSKVTMYHWNPEMHKTFESVFDFMNPKSSATKWTVYYPDKKFTYTIDFTDNSPEKVSDVVLYVHTADGRKVPLEAEYDEVKDTWCASIDMGHSSDGYYPVNCSVDFTAITEVQMDGNLFDDTFRYGENSSQELSNSVEVLQKIKESIAELLYDDNTDSGELSALLGKSMIAAGLTPIIGSSIELEGKSEDEAISIVEQSLDEMSGIVNEDMASYVSNGFSQLFKDAAASLEGVSVTSTQGYDRDSLLENGAVEIKRTDGESVYILMSDDSYKMIDFVNNQVVSIDISSVNTMNLPSTRNGSDDFMLKMQSYLESTQEYWDKLRDIFTRVASLVDDVIDTIDKKNCQLADKLNDLDNTIEWIKKQPYSGKPKWQSLLQKYEKQRNKILDEAISNNKIMGWLEKNFSPNGLRIGKLGGGIFAVVDAGLVIHDAIDDISRVIKLYTSIPDPCRDDQSKADNLKGKIRNTGIGAGTFYSLQLASDIAQLVGLFVSIPAIVPSGGTSLALVGASVSLAVANFVACIAYEKIFTMRMNAHYKEALTLKCLKNCGEPDMPKCPEPPFNDDGGNGGGNNGNRNGSGNGGGANGSGTPNDDVSIDPSGFVYEGVMSNRVEGVTATIYYKEMVEDMYGDLHENVVKWDAAEYAQENPLFTDENGDYRWDVPQGLWQVKFEKEGYETTYSDWLPVPPPQLDVNIAMKQNVQPNVKSARAFEDAVEVEFDKYMQPSLLNSDNVVVLVGETPVEGTVTLLDEEESYEGSGETFASKARFVAAAPFDASDVTLLVKNRVKSYADVRMQDDFMQSFKVELEVRKIECDSVVDVAYGGSRMVKVMVLPAAASAGKTLNVRTTSSMVASTDVESVVIAEDGSAEIPVNGELPGTSALILSVDGYDIASTTVINVKKGYMKTEAPKANIASGSTVEKGTEITLSCGTEGATIVYTLDGSCPCDDTEARTVYDGTPIVVNGNVTIKAIAYAPDMYESDIVEFTYYVDDSGVGEIISDGDVRMYPLPMRETLNISVGTGIIKKVAFTNIAGATTVVPVEPASTVSVDVSTFPAGIYIVAVETEGGKIVRKVMKEK
jgi:hypothetical protein